jgi:hypothetical protein
VPEGGVKLLLAQDDEPKNGGERASHREVRPQVDADHYGVSDQAFGVNRLERTAGDQSEWQVVQEVVRDADCEARYQPSERGCKSLRPVKSRLCVSQRSNTLYGIPSVATYSTASRQVVNSDKTAASALAVASTWLQSGAFALTTPAGSA